MSHNSKLKPLNHFTQMSLGLGFHVLALSPTILTFFCMLSLSLSRCLSKTRGRERQWLKKALVRALQRHTQKPTETGQRKKAQRIPSFLQKRVYEKVYEKVWWLEVWMLLPCLLHSSLLRAPSYCVLVVVVLLQFRFVLSLRLSYPTT
jgi:hypothetical protein